MKLYPYPKRTERWRKVVKHVFNIAERWWEVFGDLASWQRDWTTLRATGCFHQDEGHLVIRGDAERVADQNHDAWLAAAERAVDQALAAKRDYATESWDKRCYVGDDGVTVYASNRWHLITCFRPGRVGSRISPAQRLDHATRRAAVRRCQRRASLGQGPTGRPEEETGHAT